MEDAKPKAAKPKAATLTNLRGNPNKSLGLDGFGQVVMTAAQLADKHLMARVQRGIETGVLSLS